MNGHHYQRDKNIMDIYVYAYDLRKGRKKKVQRNRKK
jgi:hypothetical protein